MVNINGVVRDIFHINQPKKTEVRTNIPKLHHCDVQPRLNTTKCIAWLFEMFTIEVWMTLSDGPIKRPTSKTKDSNDKRTWHFTFDGDSGGCLVFRYSRFNCSRNALDLDRYLKSIPWSSGKRPIESTCAPKQSPFQRHTQLKSVWS